MNIMNTTTFKFEVGATVYPKNIRGERMLEHGFVIAKNWKATQDDIYYNGSNKPVNMVLMEGEGWYEESRVIA
jgi:hypothetical protein